MLRMIFTTFSVFHHHETIHWHDFMTSILLKPKERRSQAWGQSRKRGQITDCEVKTAPIYEKHDRPSCANYSDWFDRH